jgi:hypothetical protein
MRRPEILQRWFGGDPLRRHASAHVTESDEADLGGRLGCVRRSR